MLNYYTPNSGKLSETLQLKYWQVVLWLTRIARYVHRGYRLVYTYRWYLIMAFLVGIIIGLSPLMPQL